MGFLGYSPQSFFSLEPTESLEILAESEERIKLDHKLMYVSIVNAIGTTHSKGYQYKDVFDDNSNSEYTEEEKEELIKKLEDW